MSLLLYGGNANFYHLPLSEYDSALAMLAHLAGPDSLVVPSAGPSYATRRNSRRGGAGDWASRSPVW